MGGGGYDVCLCCESGEWWVCGVVSAVKCDVQVVGGCCWSGGVGCDVWKARVSGECGVCVEVKVLGECDVCRVRGVGQWVGGGCRNASWIDCF